MLYRNRLLCLHSGVWLWFVFGWCCVVCFAWLLFGLSSFVCFVSAWWIRGIADEVTIASFCKAVTGTAVMARSANEEKKKSIIPNELDNGYLLLPPGVLHMSALGRFGRFTLFSPRVSHSKHLPVLCFVLCFGFGGVCCFLLFCFLFCKCLESRILRAV